MRRDVTRRIFRGRDLVAVSAQARAAFGDDAVVLRTSSLQVGAASAIEIVAAPHRDVERFRARMTPKPERPSVIAFVGPTGAGKTTTAVKAALHPDAFGDRRVGFVTLDTYRAGAVAQLETYAQVAGVPLEVAYEPADVAPALARLADRDVVIVDTPGRGPKAGDAAEWRALLDAIAPDEVHLVVPATVRRDVAEAVRDAMEHATHAVLTKLDEVPEESGVADLAAALDLPVRWVTDGQSIPTDLAAGVPRLVRALGVRGGIE
ncbi:GTP-binding signal recognition particle SRP54 G- domain-containing protein [Gemmatirosa kalamazoonensis]|uniref:Flagellar biosynthesis protein FlhF n=1 Tax=Gemmatirosa kalamazoonensis TaxID=861299 RepID=W0RBC2_9BACT|nr:GTP-binding signal recognition particle SRP54 G- domain-containing protein [Gemmatirosa kalamazoonensis]